MYDLYEQNVMFVSSFLSTIVIKLGLHDHTMFMLVLWDKASNSKAYGAT